MTDPSPNVDREHDGAPTTGAPRWVKVFAIVAVALIVLVVIVMLAGGDHGPGRH